MECWGESLGRHPRGDTEGTLSQGTVFCTMQFPSREALGRWRAGERACLLPGRWQAPASAGRPPQTPADGRTGGAELGPCRGGCAPMTLTSGQTWVGLNPQCPGF